MFRACHMDGPLKGQDFDIGAPTTPKRTFWAPIGGSRPQRWHMVGFEGQLPAIEWAGMVEYALDRGKSKLTPHPEYEGMEEGTAVYFLAEP